MSEQKVTVSFYLEKTKPNSEDKCLIKMVVYCNPSKKRYTTNCHATVTEWEKINNPNLRDKDLKEIKNVLDAKRIKAEKIIEQIDPFSFVNY